MKAQMGTSIFIYVIIVVVAGLTIFFAVDKIGDLRQLGNEAEVINFLTTLDNQINNQAAKSFQSINAISLSIPSEMESVCFIDFKKNYAPNTVLGLEKERSIYKDSNIFFFPSGKFAPKLLNSISLPEDQNPLCVNAISGKLNIKLTTVADGTELSATNENDIQQDCTDILFNGNSNQKVDLVFLGLGYEEGLQDDVNNYINNHLFTTEPFQSNKDSFNVYMIDDQEPSCTISNYISCDTTSVKRIASNCPNDYIFILTNKDTVSSRIRSSSISNIAKINTRDNPLVLVHEFGHTFGKLADEYEDDASYASWFTPEQFPNCDRAGCPKWTSIPGTECKKGCSTSQFWRSIDVSIMKNYGCSSQSCKEFGPVNERAIGEKLEVYS